MKPAEIQALRRLARQEGVQLSYINAAGQPREASPETLLGILRALGHPLQALGDLPDVLAALRHKRQQQVLEPVTVAWDGKPTQATAHLPPGRGSSRIRLRLEDGTVVVLRAERAAGPVGARSASAGSGEQRVTLPSLPLGYHCLEAEVPEGVTRSLIISAPTRSYSEGPSGKQWGLFLPLYAAHTHRSWGAGNFADWHFLSQWAAQSGARVVATLPLLAAFLDQPGCEPSPYSPASRLFWNEFYIDIEAAPEFNNSRQAQRVVQSTQFQKALAAFRKSREIDYPSQMRARRQVLEPMAEYLFSSQSRRRGEFQRFLRQRPEVTQYARFRATGERLNLPWPQWPERPRNGVLRASDYSEEAVRYHVYVQWLAHQQLEELADRGRRQSLRFYLDLPLGVHPHGYDVWRERDLFAFAASAGAPPDPFFSKGQDWGFAPLHPQRLREDGYRYVREYLRFQMRHTDLLRIDHVMGLHRLYWIPDGLPASQGAFVTCPAHEWYAIYCLESVRHKAVLVGENLGTVPPEVNRAMDRHRLRQMFVLQYELRPDPRQPVRTPPRPSVASLNTHDMPTFAALWKGEDISDRARLGLVPGAAVSQERRTRQTTKAALVQFLQREGWLAMGRPTPAAVLRACLSWLSASPADLVLINLEDLILEELPQNVPGTSRERPNWRRKARLALEELQKDEWIRQVLDEVHRWRRVGAGGR